MAQPSILSQPSKENLQAWEKKLIGKQYIEGGINAIHEAGFPEEYAFTDTDLPGHHRILRPGSAMTFDLRMDRLNVHLNDKGKVIKVNYG
ncbi:MAG: hypothetical protein DHS80DRAFT_13377 [Piptocephalis tieghemiana]|nr:MAG: hypothetical protein DHS80DRAFT_13377 [Piptocephalis tieghemiana]